MVCTSEMQGYRSNETEKYGTSERGGSTSRREKASDIGNMSHYLREHLQAVGELPHSLRETMASIGDLDDRVQKISEVIDQDIGEVARARKRYYQQLGEHIEDTVDSEDCETEKHDESESRCPEMKIKERRAKRPPKGQKKRKGRSKVSSKKLEEDCDHDEHGPVPDGWRTPEVKALEEKINRRIDLVLRMADEKWRLAQYAYDRLDVNIRRLDADLGRMETDLRRQGVLPPRQAPATPSRKRRRTGANDGEESTPDWHALSDRDDLPVHPNEPVYCICMQVSYGEMVGCDNPSCDNGEWFHFGCVKLTKRPPGRWLCPGCTAQRRQARRTGGSAGDLDLW